jgi:hypothetical protein
MSMHLVGPHMTTTKYNRKKKASKNKRLAKAQQEHEAWLESMGVGKKQLQEKLYDEHGQRKHFGSIPDYSEHQATATLSNRVAGSAPQKQRNVYSGERTLLGVATMHKSNMVPVFADKKEDAKDIAAMRRN